MADVIDITGDGGVIKQIVRRAQVGVGGPSDDLPLVDVHYVGILAETGKVFYSTFEDNHTFTFELGKGTVIKAWDIALRTMKVGELARITCKPEYAYGIYGFPPDIPPRATLIFEVELVACTTWKGFGLLAAEERARLEDLKKKKKGAAKEERKKKRQQEKEAATARAHALLEAKRAQGKGKGKAK